MRFDRGAQILQRVAIIADRELDDFRCFLDPRALDFYPDWDHMADGAVNLLRTDAGRDPYDRGISDLVGELSTRSEEFRTRWAKHNVRLHHTGTKNSSDAVGSSNPLESSGESPTRRGQDLLSSRPPAHVSSLYERRSGACRRRCRG